MKFKSFLSQRQFRFAIYSLLFVVILFFLWRWQRTEKSTIFAPHDGTEKIVQIIRESLIKAPSSVKPSSGQVWDSPVIPVVQQLLKNVPKKDRFFVEVNGKYSNDSSFKDREAFFSNSLVLEVDFGWTGLIVEPNEDVLKEYLKYRTCHITPFCLSAKSTFEELEHDIFFVTKLQNNPLLFSGIEEDMNNHDNDPNPSLAERPCVPLNALMRAVGRTRIDYLSLNMEESMLETLETIPFQELDIKVISARIPNKYPDEDHEEQIRDFFFNRNRKPYNFVTSIKRPMLHYEIFAQR